MTEIFFPIVCESFFRFFDFVKTQKFPIQNNKVLTEKKPKILKTNFFLFFFFLKSIFVFSPKFWSILNFSYLNSAKNEKNFPFHNILIFFTFSSILGILLICHSFKTVRDQLNVHQDPTDKKLILITLSLPDVFLHRWLHSDGTACPDRWRMHEEYLFVSPDQLIALITYHFSSNPDCQVIRMWSGIIHINCLQDNFASATMCGFKMNW